MMFSRMIVSLILMILPNLILGAENSVIAGFEDSATIHGKVIDQDNRQPIIGAVVTLDGNNQTLFESVTKKNGKFQFTRLKTEVQNLTVTHIGYEDYQQRIDLNTIAEQSLEIALVSNLIKLSPIVIIGQAPSINKKLAGTASKISTKTVELIQPIGTQELLELIPGINGYADDGFGNSRLSIGIRGLNPRRSSRILILEDGVPIQPAVYIYPNAYYNPPADRIDSVEVIKGSSAIRFGPQTMGGVINYITRRPNGSKGFAYRLTGGSNRYRSLFTELRGIGNDSTQTDLQFLYKGGDGFRENNTFNQMNATLKTQLQLSSSKLLYIKANTNYENSAATYTGLTEYSFEKDPNFNPKEDDNFKIIRPSLDIIYTNKITSALVANTIAYVNVFDRRWWREDDIFVRPSALRSDILSPIPYFQGGDLVRTGGGKSNFGILRTFYTGGIEQNYNLAHQIAGQTSHMQVGGRVHWERFIDDKKVGNKIDARNADSVYYTGTPDKADDPVKIVGQSHHYETFALSLYADETIEWEKLILKPGLRFEVFEQERVDRLRGSVLDDKVSSVFLPGIGVNYQFEQLNFFGGVHRGYTPPSSGTLKVTNFGQNVGSGGLDLKAEKSWNVEIGLRLWQPLITLEASAFLVKISDLVAAGRGTAFKNLGKVDNQGVELGLAVKSSAWTALLPDFNLSYTYLQTEIKSGQVKSSIVAGKDVDLAGNQLPYAPTHTLTIGAVKNIGQKLRLRSDLRFVDRVFTDFENTNKTSNRGDMGPIPSYSILNVSLDYTLTPTWQFFLAGKNILDKVYIGSRLHSNPGQPQANLSSGILIGPRRQINVGIRRSL
ncbi:TonB-dependent receptor [Candidatus Poribacteria bacterium]|nr:TonB-dependent receptor [Candidatus Poribacteria bacterium]